MTTQTDNPLAPLNASDIVSLTEAIGATKTEALLHRLVVSAQEAVPATTKRKRRPGPEPPLRWPSDAQDV